jgi:hypothetical protein
MEPWAADKKALSWCGGVTSSFPGSKPKAPKVTSVTNDKGYNEMVPGLYTDPLAFALRLRKTRKTSARKPSDERAVRPVITSNGVPFLQMRSIGSHSTSGREKEGKKES